MKRSIVFAITLASGLATERIAASTPSHRRTPAFRPRFAVIAFQQQLARPTSSSATSPTCRRSTNRSATSSRHWPMKSMGLRSSCKAQGDKLSDAERANRTKTIEDKKSRPAFRRGCRRTICKARCRRSTTPSASKVYDVLSTYAQQQGYTAGVDGSEASNSPCGCSSRPDIDITKAVIDATT